MGYDAVLTGSLLPFWNSLASPPLRQSQKSKLMGELAALYTETAGQVMVIAGQWGGGEKASNKEMWQEKHTEKGTAKGQS